MAKRKSKETVSVPTIPEIRKTLKKQAVALRAAIRRKAREYDREIRELEKLALQLEGSVANGNGSVAQVQADAQALVSTMRKVAKKAKPAKKAKKADTADDGVELE